MPIRSVPAACARSSRTAREGADAHERVDEDRDARHEVGPRGTLPVAGLADERVEARDAFARAPRRVADHDAPVRLARVADHVARPVDVVDRARGAPFGRLHWWRAWRRWSARATHVPCLAPASTLREVPVALSKSGIRRRRGRLRKPGRSNGSAIRASAVKAITQENGRHKVAHARGHHAEGHAEARRGLGDS